MDQLKPKANEGGRTGCELKTCQELKPEQWDSFGFIDDYNKCIKSEDGKSCLIKKCEDFNPPFCGSFSPKYSEIQYIEEKRRF